VCDELRSLAESHLERERSDPTLHPRRWCTRPTRGSPIRPAPTGGVGDKLAGFDEQKSRIVELRFFRGLTIEEAARVLDVSSRTVARDWHTARVWLFHELTKGRADGHADVETR